jgi:threonine dehydrogenase-like Zn-dependent dehydrogenase
MPKSCLDAPSLWFYDKTMSYAIRSKSNGWSFDSFSKAPPADRVRVKIGLAGLCRTDIQAMSGERAVSPGRILGHEASGWVEYIPPALVKAAFSKELSVGDAVAFFPFLPCGLCANCKNEGPIEQCHAPSALGLDEDGAFAPFVDLPVDVLFKGPSNLSLKHLAYAEPVSASIAVLDVPSLMQSARVGVIGSGRIAQLTLAVLNAYRNTPAEHLEVERSWEEGAFDAIIETRATSDILARAVRALRPGGTLVVKSRPSSAIAWPHQEIVLRRIQVVGAPYGSFAAGLEAMSSGVLDVNQMLGPAFPWSPEGIEAALATEKQGGEIHGKLFLEIATR